MELATKAQRRLRWRYVFARAPPPASAPTVFHGRVSRLSQPEAIRRYLQALGSVVDPELRAVCGISPAFPADFCMIGGNGLEHETLATQL